MMPGNTWIRIEHLQEILDHFRYDPEINPLHPDYQKHWRGLREKHVNGIWVPQFNQWRYVPGRLGFYGTFARFEDWNREQRSRTIKTPSIRDIEWHQMYYFTEAFGFSGFSDDPKVTSDYAVLTDNRRRWSLNDPKHHTLLKPNGTYKEFREPRDALFNLHKEPKGLPLYNNAARNHLIFGTRGGGKSYLMALGLLLYDICFDGQRRYLAGEPVPNTRAVVEITSGQKAKSAETLEKLEFGMRMLSEDPACGAWRDPQTGNIIKSPFWKRMEGSLAVNNRENPWVNEYQVKINNHWRTRGSGSKVYHTVYSKQEKGGAQKSAGGRRTIVVNEEIGLNEILIDSWETNEGMIKGSGQKLAPQFGIGTSGNMDTVINARRILENPYDYNCMMFYNLDGTEQKTGFFLPAYMVDMRFKDKDGNTDVAAAKADYKQQYDEAKDSNDPNVFNIFRMNFPIYIEDMWVTGGGERLPVNEAKNREKQLRRNQEYKKLGTPVKLSWSSEERYGVTYQIDHHAEPFYEWPIEYGRKSMDGSPLIYIWPEKLYVNGNIPEDAVIVHHDPYISEEPSESLGVTYGIVNPKYIPFGLPGNCLAFSYIGRPAGGTDVYNKIQHLLLDFYNVKSRNLWYEANRGEKVRGYYLRKKRAGVLCLRPQFEQGSYVFGKKITQTGYYVGDQLQKLTLIDSINDWLLQETTLTINGEEETLKNIERWPDLFGIRQISEWNLKGNYDAVSCMQSIPLSIKEMEHSMQNRNRSNIFANFNENVKKKSWVHPSMIS